MAKKESKVFKPGPMTEGKRNIIQGLLQEYDIETAEDLQEALKDLLGSTIKGIMEAETENHLGYGQSECSDNEDSRNEFIGLSHVTAAGGRERNDGFP